MNYEQLVQHRRKEFEGWLLHKFPDLDETIVRFSNGSGYTDEDINSLWIGFNAGAQLALDGFVKE